MVKFRQVQHDIVVCRTHSGDRKSLSFCMLQRLNKDEFVDGCVPDDIPSYNSPVGSKCHPEWRGGCQ